MYGSLSERETKVAFCCDILYNLSKFGLVSVKLRHILVNVKNNEI